ncbi:DUF6531 domain-containing protein [Streptomyces sp. NPDC047197]|uniref:DUF6531 domain-containing protein n=1 Tax=Streptomyces sp. NPDC047197 TaxID=3155477 RepID=UPI0033FA56B0
MVDLNPLHYINKFNHMAGDNMASMMEFLGISDPAVDPDGIREIAKKWRGLAKAVDASVKEAEQALRGVTWEGKTATAFSKRAKKTRTQAATMADSLRDGADALDKFADEAHELLTELNVIILEIIEVEMAGLALSVLTGGASAVVGSLAAGARFAKAMAIIGRIEHAGTAMARTIRAVLEVIRGLARALKALKEIKTIARVGKLAGSGAKYAALDTLLKDPATFKDPAKLAETLAMGAALGVGLGGLGKLLGKGLGKLKPKDLAKLRGAMKLNCASFQRLSMRPSFDKLPASVRNALKKFVRDPIDVATGDMALTRTDVHLPGVLPLLLERTHISSYRFGGWFGPSWASTLDQRVQADDEGFVYAAADGARLCFPMPDPETGGAVTPETPGSHLTLTWDEEIDGAVRMTDPDSGLTQVFHSPVPAADGEAVDLPLQYIQDRNGNRITIEYDEGDIPAAVTHSGGYHIALDRDEANSRITGLRLLDHTSPSASATTLITFAYDEAGHLTEEFNSSDLPMRYTYDEAGRITSWTDRNGTTYWYRYDERGRVTETGGTGNALASTLTYEDTTHTTRVTDSLGHTRVYEHNAQGRLIRETDPLGHVTTQEWDAELQLTAVTDPMGRTLRCTYDERGLVTRVTRPDGSEVTAEYNELRMLTRAGNPDGTAVKREYSPQGNPLVVTDAAGRSTRFTFDDAGRPTRACDALGHTTVIRTDRAGLPVEVTDPLGSVTRWERDALGRPTVFTDPLGAQTRLEWTVEGKLARRIAADGSQEVWLYDGEGNCTHHTDPNGAVERFEYTFFDLLSARTGADGVRYAFTYDTELRLTSVTDPQGLTWDYEYDAAGRQTAESDFDGRVQSYAHDGVGQLIQRTTPLGDVMRFERDALGQVTRKDVAGRITHFSYDVMGRVLRASEPGTDIEWCWDEKGQLISENVAGRALSYAYDELGRCVSRTTPTGATSTWAYDAAGRSTELTSAGRSIRFERDVVGRETSRRIGDNLTLSHAFDELGRTTVQALAVPGATLRDRSYAYRPDGNLTSVVEASAGTAHAYTLDPVGRPLEVTADNWSETYTYDAAGNQTNATWPNTHPHPGARGERTYDGTRMCTAGRIHCRYDAAGRLVHRTERRLSGGKETWHYTWNPDDQLTQVTAPDGATWRYTYDPLGRRTSKQKLAADGETVAERTDFTWDGTRLAEQYDHRTGVALTWDYLGHRPLAQWERKFGAFHDDAENEGRTDIDRTGVGGVEAIIPQTDVDSRFFAVVTDLIGSPTELVDETGCIAWHTRTTVWGATAWNADSTAHTPLRFPGQYADPETGLHYNYFRHYDPKTARYVTPDPLGLAPSPNPCSYVVNPHGWSDPLGLAATHNPIYPERRQAFNAAKDMAGIPHSAQPIRQWVVGGDATRAGWPDYVYKPVNPAITSPDYNPKGGWGRYYQYETPDGVRVIAEHTADPNAPLPHFHAGTPQTGEPRDVDMTGKTYKELQPKHHLYYRRGGKCG